MIENYRHFEVGPDPFGRRWQVDFRWQQTAISIRHSDSVDVKFQLSCGEEVQEKVIALPHPDLLALCHQANRPLTDALCMKLAGLHLEHMVLTDADMEKILVTASFADLERGNAILEQEREAAAART